MPVSMITADVGSSWYVSGRSSVNPASGPSPGRTPTTVPHRHPTTQYRRLSGRSATENPCRSCVSASISSLGEERQRRQVDAEEGLEEIEGRQTRRDRGEKRAPPTQRRQGEEHHEQEECGRHEEAGPLEQQPCDHRRGHRQGDLAI